jgi:hypothetical protein
MERETGFEPATLCLGSTLVARLWDFGTTFGIFVPKFPLRCYEMLCLVHGSSLAHRMLRPTRLAFKIQCCGGLIGTAR